VTQQNSEMVSGTCWYWKVASPHWHTSSKALMQDLRR